MSNEILIRDQAFRIIGRITVEDNGDKTVRDFEYRIIGRYVKATDMTYDFSWRMIAKGDATGMLIGRNGS